MITDKLAERLLAYPIKAGADFAELYTENRKFTSVSVLNGRVESANSGIDGGLGLRIINGDKVIYTYTNDITESSLISLAKSASDIIVFKENSQIKPFCPQKTAKVQNVLIPPLGVSKLDIYERLNEADAAAREYSNLITEVTTSFAASEKEFSIYNTQGLKVQDKHTRTRVTIYSVASSKTEKQIGYFGPGALMGWELLNQTDFKAIARNASKIAVTMLNAGSAPSGRFPVVIDNGFGGVLFHEACGHGLEAIAIAKNSSVFTGKLGEQIASPKVTAIDDGTLLNIWGSIGTDDEGAPATKNVLIENGILKNYMTDNFYGKKLGMPSTGACRRQSYKFAPVPRMTNTYIAPGADSEEDIISSIDYGVYCKNMGGGSVNPATGEFNFAVSEAYIIKNGKIAQPVRGATLIGKGDEIIKNIEMVSPNMQLACGMCGASSGSIPVTVGQPMIKISQMTVGGKA